MPAIVLSTHSAAATPLFGVVGVYSQSGGAAVCHVAIARESKALRKRGRIRVVHVGPPLVAGACPVDAIGWLDGLSGDDYDRMEFWIQNELKRAEYWSSDVAPKSPWACYTIHPFRRDIPDSETGRIKARRYSCLGFVATAYEEAFKVQLFDLATVLPFDEATARTVFTPQQLQAFETEHERFGLFEEKKCAYPGAALHALFSPNIRTQPYKMRGPVDAVFP